MSRPHKKAAVQTEEWSEFYRSLRLPGRLAELHVQSHPQRPHPPHYKPLGKNVYFLREELKQ